MNQSCFAFITRVLLLSVPFFWGTSMALAQSTMVPLNHDYYHLIDRLEIKRGKLSEGFHSSLKPYERKAVVALTDSIMADARGISLTRTDRKIIGYLRTDNWEWALDKPATAGESATGMLGSMRPEARYKKRFWEQPAAFYSAQNEDYLIHVNGITDNILGVETNTETPLWFTARGAEIRGLINKKLGFYSTVIENQGTFAEYVRNYAAEYNMPGEGLAKTLRRTGVDFMHARGYITFRPLKSINLQFGHDRNFIGNGFRSLFLSDHSSPYLFLRIDTQLGRFHYTNLWTSMLNTQIAVSGPSPLWPKKSTVTHHLSINLTDRLNVGIFESEVYSREGTGRNLEFNYLNPIIFYRWIESYLGSTDNAMLGFDFRWLADKRMSFYGQFMLDEFLTRYFFTNTGSWTNKWAAQLGVKYVDVFGVPNLDIQGEYNVIRPYTYTHRDGSRNYVHYGQPLAHPLGANLREYLGIVRYQPHHRLTLYGTWMFVNQGRDNDGQNWGGSLLRDYDSRIGDFGNQIGQGTATFTRMLDARLSYMLAHNLFLEGRYLNRWVELPLSGQLQRTRLTTFALRYHIPYRHQVF